MPWGAPWRSYWRRKTKSLSENASFAKRDPRGGEVEYGEMVVLFLLPSDLQATEFVGKGHMLADIAAIIGTLDVVFGEIDR